MKETISKIREIDFTAREIDVISCILNIKGSKKISQFLSISNRTVEGYILNIMRKMRTNSQEGIKDFVESSEELPVLISHYNNLAIKAFFIKKLRDIAYASTRPKNSIVLDNNSDVLVAIREYLSEAKIIINKEKPLNGESYQLVAISKEYVRRIINGEKFSSVIFICLDSEIGEMELKNFQHITFIDCSDHAKIYHAVFRIIEILNTDSSISKHIAEFERYRNNIITQNRIRFSNNKEGFHREAISGINSISRVLNKNLVLLSIIFIIAFTSIIWINIGNSGRKIFMEHKSIVSSNFAIPNSTILLQRRGLIKKISSQINISKEIGVIALVGRGGAGKTILARDYARGQASKIIWEINAETRASIISSFEQLAFALCVDIKEKQDLTKLLKQHKPEQREKQLLLFVQDRLKENNNWLLIYDNVESFGKIKEYFPYNYNAWGKGKIIITTRDINIKNNTYIDDQNIIQVDSLNEEEKHQLFSNIMGDYLKNHDKESTEKFMEQIPPYPLDISLAAYYIRDTNITYEGYLEYIREANKMLAQEQESIMQDANEYTKTRYGIITLSAQHILSKSKSFENLLLLISLLDSQKIPKDLLLEISDRKTLNDFVRELRRHSFVLDNGNESNDSISLHRDTQSVTSSYMLSIFAKTREKKILSTLLYGIEGYISKLVEFEEILKLKELQTHTEIFLNNIQNKAIKKSELGRIKAALGIIYYHLGYDEKAKELLEISINDIEKNKIEAGWTLTHLGAVYRKLGKDYKKSLEVLNQAVEVYKSESKDHYGAGIALTHLGNVYRTLGKLDLAKEALQESVDILLKHKDQYAATAKAIGYLGVVYREQSYLDKAKELLEESLKIYNDNPYPKNSSVYAGTLAHLAIVYRMKEEYKPAKTLLTQSIEVYKTIRPESHPDIDRNILNLGIIEGELGHYKSSKTLLDTALKNYEKNYGVNHIETGKVLNHFGRFYILNSEFDNALTSLNRAKEILGPNNHPEYYRSWELLGDAYSKMLELKMFKSFSQRDLEEEIAACYNNAYQISISQFPNDSSSVKRIQGKL